MRLTLRQLRLCERGHAIVMVAIGLSLILGFAILAIDVGKILLFRTRLQNAADAAALAGAFELPDPGATVATAQAYAGLNCPQQGQVLAPSDVVLGHWDTATGGFQPDGLPTNAVLVTTRRAEANGNPLDLHFTPALNISSLADVSARAVAGISDLCGANCMKPLVPPDRWYDADGDHTFNPDPVTNPDEYYDPQLTGYIAPDDVGVRVMLKGGHGSSSSFLESHYYPVCFPPVNKGTPVGGADVYRGWLRDCTDPSIIVEVGDILETEPGFMEGPTGQGILYLINQDPSASWDDETCTVINSAYTRSPRIVIVPLFDPAIGPQLAGEGRNHLTISKLGVLFVEDYIQATGEIVGRFITTGSSYGPPCEDPGYGNFVEGVRLLQ